MSDVNGHRDYRRGPMRTVWPSPAMPARRRASRGNHGDYGVPAEPGWRDVDWPAATRTAVIGGRDVNYVRLGEGADRAIVFIHGLGGCWQNWIENLPATAATGYDAIALDLPGFGRSVMPNDTISMTGYAAAVNELCDELGLASVAIVGNSMGGFVAADMAIHHPERVERLVLVNAAGISTTLARNPISERVGKFLVTGVIGRGGGKPPSGPQTRTMIGRPGFRHLAMAALVRHPTLLARELLAEQLHSLGAPGFMPAVEAIISYGFIERLHEITCPTLVIQGTDDVIVPLGDAFEYERRIPLATTLILDDTGHVPMCERPRTFNRSLMEFLGQETAPHSQDN